MESVQKVPQNYEQLLKLYNNCQREIEEQNQTIYDCNRKLKTANSLEKEYLCEIESLQFDLSNVKKQFEDKIAQLEENIQDLRGNQYRQTSTLEAELASKETAIKELESQIEVLNKLNKANKSVNFDNNDEESEIIALKTENEALFLSLEESERQLKSVQEVLRNLQAKVAVLEEENDCLKETFSIKKEELLKANELIKTLQDEAFCCKSELDSLKNNPLELKSKGNSLFAEVDDRRVKLQSAVTSMKQEYVSMKQERGSLLKEITFLRKENALLCTKWKSDVVDKAYDYDMLENSYKRRINSLEDIISSYKKEVTDKNKLLAEIESDDCKLAVGIINTVTKQTESVREQLRLSESSNCMITWQLAEARQELRKLQIQTKRFELELSEYKSLFKTHNLEKPKFPEFSCNNKEKTTADNGSISLKIRNTGVTKKLHVDDVKKNLFSELEPAEKGDNLDAVKMEETSFPDLSLEQVNVLEDVTLWKAKEANTPLKVVDLEGNSLSKAVDDLKLKYADNKDEMSEKSLDLSESVNAENNGEISNKMEVVSEDDENKENFKVTDLKKTKKVQFSEDTVESKPTRRRRGAFVARSVHYSTLFK